MIVIKVNELSEHYLDLLFDEVRKHIKSHNLSIFYNLREDEDVAIHLDFFTRDEFKEIAIMAYESYVDFYLVNYNENSDDILKSFDGKRDIVIDLTSRNYTYNDLHVSSLCDIFNIPILSSSVYSLNLCNNRISLLAELKSKTTTALETYYYNTDNNDKIIQTFKGKSVIIRNSQKINDYYDKKSNVFILSDEHRIRSEDYSFIIQEYIHGMEIEVPFIIVNNEIYSIGFYKRVTSSNKGKGFTYIVKPFNPSTKQKEKILETLEICVEGAYLKYYGRLDLIINENNVVLLDVIVNDRIELSIKTV